MLLLALISFAAAPRPLGDLNIIFAGNSLTGYNNLPGMVENLLESDGSKRKVNVEYHSFPHIDDAGKSPMFMQKIADKKWDIAVFQGAMISMSLSREYPQDDAIKVVNTAKKAGARTILYVEWPRRGIDESVFSLNQYRRIQRVTGSEIAPACFAWEMTLKNLPKLNIYADDGNHSTENGSYVAAVAIYHTIVGAGAGKPQWRPAGVDAPALAVLEKNAKAALQKIRS